MATIYLTLSTKVDSNTHREIRIRFKHGKIDQQAKTGIFIPAEYWGDTTQQIITPNFRLITDEKRELIKYLTDKDEALKSLTSSIQTLFT